MRHKVKVLMLILIFLLPLFYLSDSLKLNENYNSIKNDAIEIKTFTDDFAIKIYIGDPFGKSYSSYEFNPDDAVLLTGAVRNTGYAGSPSDEIVVCLWLVSGKTAPVKLKSIGNYTKDFSLFPLDKAYTLKELNDNNYVGFELENIPSGTYYIMVEVMVEGSLNTRGFSGKPIVIRMIQLADFKITSTFYDLWWGFEYNITNTGNCQIEGYFNSQIEKWDDTNGWILLDELDTSDTGDGDLITIPIGQSLIGSATWTHDGQLDHLDIGRLFISITDSQGNVIQNLNGSIPYEHPTQGGKYFDSNKFQGIILDREIGKPTIYGILEQIDVNITIEVIGEAPENIGIFTRHGSIKDNCTDLELIEMFSDVMTPYLDSSLPYEVEGGSSGSLSLAGNNLTLNPSTIPEFTGLDLESQLKITYKITCNFSRTVNKPWFSGSSGLRSTIGFQEKLMHPSQMIYKGFKSSALYGRTIQFGEIQPPQDPYCPNGSLGIIVWYHRLVNLYGESETMGFLNTIYDYLDYLDANTGIGGIVYFVDNPLLTQTFLESMGFTSQEQNIISSLSLSDAAGYIHDNTDPNSIAKAIEEIVTAEAEKEVWDYMLLIGGVDVIPMRLVPHPLQPYGQQCFLFDCKDWTNSEIATDFFYGDFTPEAEAWDNQAFVPEVMVGRIPGRSLEAMETLLEAGKTSSTGRPLVISYFKGEDSARKIINSWGVKEEDTLLDTENNFTQGKINETLNPGNYGSPSNFPYSFVLYSNHGGWDSFKVEQSDVDTWDDYADGSRPFVFIRACLSGYVGDTGQFWSGETHLPNESIALDYLEKGVAGILAATRITYGPPPDTRNPLKFDFHDGGNTTTKPPCGPGVPDSLSGVYYEGTIEFEGRNVNVLEIDNHGAGRYWMTIFDFNDNGIYEYDEIYKANHPDWKERKYFVSPYNNYACYRLNVDTKGGVFDLVTNIQEDWNDIFCALFTGESGEGIMDGLNVGEAFLNAREKYSIYALLMRLAGFHEPRSEEDAFDIVTLLAYNLYGIPFYRPNIVDPPGPKNYTLTTSSMDAWGFNCTLGIENYTHTIIGEHDLFEIPGAMLTGGSFLPRLPMIFENISIPAGLSIEDVQILENTSSILPGVYNITISTEGTNDTSEFSLKSKSKSSGIYPGKLYDYTIIEEDDGSSNLYLALYPFSFDSDTGKVKYYSNLTLHLDFKDTEEDSISLAVYKSILEQTMNTYQVNLDIANNGSNIAYDIDISETINGRIYHTDSISMLSTSGHNGSCLLRYTLQPITFFSGSIPFETTLICNDASGTPWSIKITANIYIQSYLGIIVIVIICIAALGIVILALSFRSKK
ncbi:MAG: hypothetical protein GF329_06610 [Candidatus Lokiarchaeota archaeon]|nr:hypothetical protein [Candidatus Lokiarchaeota archaeon]